MPSTSTPFEVSLQFEGTQKGGSSNIGSVFGKKKKIEVTNEDLKAVTATGAAAISVTDKTPSNELTEPMVLFSLQLFFHWMIFLSFIM